MAPKDMLRDQVERGKWITNFWSNILKKGTDKVTLGSLTHRQKLLETYWSEFIASHRLLMAEDQIEKTEYVSKGHFAVIEENYFDCAAKICDELDKLRSATTSRTPAPADAGNQSQLGHNTSKLVQLAKINLPVFDGDWLNWPSFKGLFESLVHNDPEVPKPFKLQQLLAHVSGEAAAMLENTDVSDDGYDGAWKDLVECYENSYLLLCKYMRCMFDCAPVAKSSAAELKRITSIFKRSKRAFNALKRPVDKWSDWLLFLCLEKLDNATKMYWQTSLGDSKEIPTFDELLKFLECRTQALTVTYGQTSKPPTSLTSSSVNRPHTKGKQTTVALHTSAKGSDSKKRACPLCQKGHSIGFCRQFKGLAVGDRWTKAKALKLCVNCLRPKHPTKACNCQFACRIGDCNKRHHFLLHQSSGATTGDYKEPNDTQKDLQASTESTDKTLQVSAYTATTSSCAVFLGTAKVIIENDLGEKMTIRALLDHAAESSFITERVAQLLRVHRQRVAVHTSGLQGTATGEARTSTLVKLRSPQNDKFSATISALILPSLTGMVPAERVKLQRWRHLEGLSLADPDYALPGKVDAILGADIYGALITGAVKFNSAQEPSAISTVFGYIIVGPSAGHATSKGSTRIMHCATHELSDQLQKFWELEEVSAKVPALPADDFCETQFRRTHTRDNNGRFIVRLPVSNDESLVLANNRRVALQLFLSTERKLQRSEVLREKYIGFMGEYALLQHMIKVDTPPRQSAFYLPHHAVFRGHVRVVFNASSRSPSSLSLNDKLLTGPKLQSELWVVLSRWRMHRVAFSSDIVKMFRQIQVHEDDRDLQRILWRDNPDSQVAEYQLTTVTYGTAPAPFLALRVLLQLAEDEEKRFPLGAQAIRENSYVDDIFSGADTLERAIEVRNQVVQIFAASQFPLGKWAASNPQIIKNSAPAEIQFSDADTVSALGLIWAPSSDNLLIKVSLTDQLLTLTKRSILSTVAKLFDPLGWLSPVIVIAKIIIQDLWIDDVTWDEPVSSNHATEWLRFRSSLQELDTIRVPHWTSFSSAEESTAQLHGFCDASTRAYTACVYLRTVSSAGTAQVHLIVAKTKVAPVKTQTIPRLELCGAVLLSKLLNKVQNDLHLRNISAYLWTDSEVVLAWLRGHASK